MTEEWRTEAVEAVLRVLAQTGLGVSPGGIAANIERLLREDVDVAAVEDALERLADRNMVKSLDAGDYYRLTERGREYATAEFGDDVFGYID
ncbi:hypothetical protein GCM10009037_13670 [Halarchaeum grantii]|uniref:Uncharacterized protein n=1 Tax=Halarchaeum grantii TaxID=1193105 RepID=A0A830F1U6_9EURY|nr:hypothetical protein [Halarchaeum grantii]GGL31206.1 hypothetical protein GCM10009037_13670 [Halarchaeum grantii]